MSAEGLPQACLFIPLVMQEVMVFYHSYDYDLYISVSFGCVHARVGELVNQQPLPHPPRNTHTHTHTHSSHECELQNHNNSACYLQLKQQGLNLP